MDGGGARGRGGGGCTPSLPPPCASPLRSCSPALSLARSASPTTCHSWASLNCMSTRHISGACPPAAGEGTERKDCSLRSPYELNLIGIPATSAAAAVVGLCLTLSIRRRPLRDNKTIFTLRRTPSLPSSPQMAVVGLSYRPRRGPRGTEAILVGLRAMWSKRRGRA